MGNMGQNNTKGTWGKRFKKQHILMKKSICESSLGSQISGKMELSSRSHKTSFSSLFSDFRR